LRSSFGGGSLLGSALAQTSAASPPKAERPEIKVGDKWVHACTYGLQKLNPVTEITSVDQSGIKETMDGKAVTLTLDLNLVDSPEVSFSEHLHRFSFPLEVGKQWTAKHNFVNHENGGSGTERTTVKVVSYEKVRVPAGEFDAFKLKWDSTWTDKSNAIGTTQMTYWYAPAARNVVKSDRSRHWDPDLHCELTEFQLQP